ncbi:MAG: NAD(P)/FAD-dependent oxidoreductase [Rhizomicrobium sp.]
MQYDACVIGAGADGLAAAATLAASGLKTAVVERDAHCGGRCATREFHPGYRASPFVDELPAIPPAIIRALDLARRGTIFVPPSASLALWPDRRHLQLPWAETDNLAERAAALRAAIIERVLSDADAPPKRDLFVARKSAPAWPGEELAVHSLADLLAGESGGPDADAHRMAALLAGRICDAALAGSALHLLAAGPSGMPVGGLGRLAESLRAAAQDAGAEISCGLEVADIRRKRGRVVGVGLADGSEIVARAVVSTLDLKRTFLSLFPWSELPRSVTDRVGGFRASAGTARLLLALGAPPVLPDRTDALAMRGPIYVSPDRLDQAHRAWLSGAVPNAPPLVLRVVSAMDPSLAPDGAACMTVSLGAVPHMLFDGAWTRDKREQLRDATLSAIEAVLPGTSSLVVGAELIVPPDFENMLGATGGDLTGGELAADQMLGFRPFADCAGTRTPIEGLYLAGPSSALAPFASCASGVAAARAVIADLAAGKLK